MNAPAKIQTRFSPLHWQGRLPMVLQDEAAECGIACLAMAANYHGHDTDIRSLRLRFPQSAHGATLKSIMEIAVQLELTPRALRFDLNAMESLQTPCILHWNMSHFVVLKRFSNGKAIIHDPARGRIECGERELDEAASGVALELLPTADFRPLQDRHHLRITDLWSNISGLGQSLALIITLSLLLQASSLASPLYLQFVVDEVISRGDTKLLVVLAAGFTLLLLFEVGTRVLRQLVILSFSSRMNLQLATNLFNHLIRLPMDYFQTRHLGDIVSRHSSIGSVRDLFTGGVVSAIVDGLLSLMTVTAMLIYSVPLTLIVLSITLAYLAVRAALYPSIRRRNTESIVADARTQSSMMESIRGIATIKLHEKESERLNQWQNQLIKTMRSQIGAEKFRITEESLNHALFGLAHIAVIYIAAHSVIDGLMSVGMLFAYMSFTQRFIGSVEGLIDQFIAFKMLGIHLERLADIVLTPREVTIEKSSLPLVNCPTASTLKVENLSFKYKGNTQNSFENINFSVEPGECVAITGASGSGKTTLLHCMMGLLTPASGDISWDGKSIFRLASYRTLIATVMQNDQLLSGSILDNICFFDTAPNMERLAACAEAACIHTDILQLPMQYNTLIGDMGSCLSGGQKQRICIARALYRQPLILFMDEATSHLDSACEAQLSRNIKQLPMTRILVAHRRETIVCADRVIEL